MEFYSKEQLKLIAYGATFLGSGGGGPMEPALSLIDKMETKGIETVRVEDVPDEELGVVVAALGAPEAMKKAAGGLSLWNAFQRMNTYVDVSGEKSIAYLIPGEIGGYNLMAPIEVAYQGELRNRKLKVVDCDSVGRAAPALTMSVFAGAIDPRPSILAKHRESEPQAGEQALDETIAIWMNKIEDVEAIARPLLAATFENYAAMSIWKMTGRQLRETGPIEGSVALCHEIGRCMVHGTHPVDKVLALLNQKKLNSRLLTIGKITEQQQVTGGGFDSMRVTITGTKNIELYGLNENLIAWDRDHGVPLAMGPDSICYLTTDGYPFSNAGLNLPRVKGREVAVIAIEARKEVKKSASIKKAFAKAIETLGYPGPYRSFL